MRLTPLSAGVPTIHVQIPMFVRGVDAAERNFSISPRPLILVLRGHTWRVHGCCVPTTFEPDDSCTAVPSSTLPAETPPSRREFAAIGLRGHTSVGVEFLKALD